jgi:hypothetical protein
MSGLVTVWCINVYHITAGNIFSYAYQHALQELTSHTAIAITSPASNTSPREHTSAHCARLPDTSSVVAAITSSHTTAREPNQLLDGVQQTRHAEHRHLLLWPAALQLLIHRQLR